MCRNYVQRICEPNLSYFEPVVNYPIHTKIKSIMFGCTLLLQGRVNFGILA